MSDSYMKDIVYDLIESKLKIREIEDKLVKLIKENEELTRVNNNLTEDVNKWKSQVIAYINDYRNTYNKDTLNDNFETKQDTNNEIIIEDTNETVKEDDNTSDKISEDTKKSRSEYMKEYMRNKRKKQKEELKQIFVNKQKL
jgi:hypothetical protein